MAETQTLEVPTGLCPGMNAEESFLEHATKFLRAILSDDKIKKDGAEQYLEKIKVLANYLERTDILKELEELRVLLPKHRESLSSIRTKLLKMSNMVSK